MMNNVELTEKVRLLKQLDRKMSDLETRIENLKNELKEEMTSRGVDELKGEDWVITWKSVSSKRFDQSAFKALNPTMYEDYSKITESKRFVVK